MSDCGLRPVHQIVRVTSVVEGFVEVQRAGFDEIKCKDMKSPLQWGTTVVCGTETREAPLVTVVKRPLLRGFGKEGWLQGDIGDVSLLGCRMTERWRWV